ncbi:carbohydrate esterase family 12 protein [Amanita thiersii Skay4041]|uniref:Carbohydrate esterase family 12 protein n=1 Tax=Amanita thiersii Skay4041 TaxID=703135 RepID=A0A2A9NUG0_9AGAR|nr:carbohydrate esterase family 12 protein [Amanita thiersii Skay4041]
MSFLRAYVLAMLSISLVAGLQHVPTSFVLIGDSTTANGTTPNSGGWGNGLCGSELRGNIPSVIPGTPCINTAHNGATTGTFVLQHLSRRHPNRSTQGAAHARDAAIWAQRPEDRTARVDGEPVLITSLTRRSFNVEDGTVADTLGPWADETILIAQQEDTPPAGSTPSFYPIQAIGPDAAHGLNRLPDDNTHLNVNGTTVFGCMVADLLVASFPSELPIVPNPPLTFNITHGIPSF